MSNPEDSTTPKRALKIGVWFERYRELQSWLQAHKGHYPKRDSVDNIEKSLGMWVNTQRKRYCKKLLSSERITLLEDLAGWHWTPRENQWNTNFSDLQSWLKTHDGKYPTMRSRDAAGKKLGLWINVQRSARHQLPSERSALLEGLPGWMWAPSEQKWNANFSNLRLWLKTHDGKYPELHSKNATSKRLGMWVSRQRVNYRKRQLSSERIALFESLPGWKWDYVEAVWDTNFSDLQSWLKTHDGKYPDFRNLDKIGSRLYKWIIVQRENYKTHQLSFECIAFLEGLPGWSWVNDGLWQKRYEELKALRTNNGWKRPPFGSPQYRWEMVQRAAYRKGTLSSERIALLEALPGWSW